MTVKYEATALVKCQFGGILYPPGRKYSGFKKPPEGLFRIDHAEELSDEAVREQKTAEKKAKKARLPSDPTPRDREEEEDAAREEEAQKARGGGSPLKPKGEFPKSGGE